MNNEGNVVDKFDEYSDVLIRLIKETILCSPKEWTNGTLTIDCDGTRIDYKLKNEIEPGNALISEELRTLIDEFYVRMARRGEEWRQAVVHFYKEDGEYKYKTDFVYPDRKENSLQEKPSKPWWKLWQ